MNKEELKRVTDEELKRQLELPLGREWLLYRGEWIAVTRQDRSPLAPEISNPYLT